MSKIVLISCKTYLRVGNDFVSANGMQLAVNLSGDLINDTYRSTTTLNCLVIVTDNTKAG